MVMLETQTQSTLSKTSQICYKAFWSELKKSDLFMSYTFILKTHILSCHQHQWFMKFSCFQSLQHIQLATEAPHGACWLNFIIAELDGCVDGCPCECTECRGHHVYPNPLVVPCCNGWSKRANRIH